MLRPWPLSPSRQTEPQSQIPTAEQKTTIPEKQVSEPKENQQKEDQTKGQSNEEQRSKTAKPQRSLRKTVERQSRAGDPMSWQYHGAGTPTL